MKILTDYSVVLISFCLVKVATEVLETEMKKRLVSCDPWIVSVSVESAMFEKLGCFIGPQKAKYRSILFNMGDSNKSRFEEESVNW